MRYHQSWYRRYVLNLPPGPNPSAHRACYGNMLYEDDGMAGWNFVTSKVHQYAEARFSKDATHIEPGRLRNNLLSSQPMCFNLFASLALDLELATRLVSALPGLGHIKRVTAVELEYAPSPKKDYLNDGTSFDAWLEYEWGDNKKGFVAIETKLTEPFTVSQNPFDDRYAKWMTMDGWWWKPGSEASYSDVSFNQLWRNHLLAFALLHNTARTYSECFCAVVSHPLDTGCPGSISSYSEHLLPSGRESLLSWPLNSLIDTWQSLASNREERSWLQSLRLRYLELEASEAAWQQRSVGEKTNA